MSKKDVSPGKRKQMSWSVVAQPYTQAKNLRQGANDGSGNMPAARWKPSASTALGLHRVGLTCEVHRRSMAIWAERLCTALRPAAGPSCTANQYIELLCGINSHEMKVRRSTGGAVAIQLLHSDMHHRIRVCRLHYSAGRDIWSWHPVRSLGYARCRGLRFPSYSRFDISIP